MRRVWVKQWPIYLTLWPAGAVLHITFLQDLIVFCSRPEVKSDVVSGKFVETVVAANRGKFGDPRLNRSREIPPDSVCGGIFDRFLNFDNCQPEPVSDVISGTAEQEDGMDVYANFGDSKLKPSEMSFSAIFRTSLTSEWKYIVTSYPVWL